MAIRRWEPLGGLGRLHDEMDRVFEDFFKPWRLLPRGEAVPEGYRLPAVDLIEQEDEFLLKAELPGVKKEDLNLEVLPDSVSLSAELTEEKEITEENFHRHERSVASFSRVIPLPVEIKSAQAKASFKDGLLEVHLPKSEAAKAQKPVKVQIS